MRMKSKLGWTVLVLVTAQLALILLSWLITAAFPELPICLTQSRYGPNAAVLGAAIYYIDQLLQNIEPLLE